MLLQATRSETVLSYTVDLLDLSVLNREHGFRTETRNYKLSKSSINLLNFRTNTLMLLLKYSVANFVRVSRLLLFVLLSPGRLFLPCT